MATPPTSIQRRPSIDVDIINTMQVVEVSDVIVEVIDARDPEGGRCLDVERFIRRMGSNKKIILLLNKVGALEA